MIAEMKYNDALKLIDKAHNEDPAYVTIDGNKVSDEFLYSERMLNQLLAYYPDSNPFIKLSAKCHHLKRWEVDRKLYPMDKQGYFNWRRVVAKHQLNIAKEILTKAEFSEEEIDKVISCLKKENIKRIPEAQIIEDVACMVFIQFYLEEFAKPHQDDKVIDILYKTMLKMSDPGIETCKKLPLSNKVAHLVKKADNLLVN